MIYRKCWFIILNTNLKYLKTIKFATSLQPFYSFFLEKDFIFAINFNSYNYAEKEI